jgi:hypothetical protein
MNRRRLLAAVALLVVAVAAAGFSLYRAFLAKPDDGLTPAQREAARRAVEAFSGGRTPPGR